MKASGASPPTTKTDCHPNRGMMPAATNPPTAAPRENPQIIVVTESVLERRALPGEDYKGVIQLRNPTAVPHDARIYQTDYLFYVANPCKPGTHTFHRTLAEFNAAAAKYNAAREAAGGKAPKGC